MTDIRFAALPLSPPRTVTATRYVTPLREGGSLPAVVEADDDGLYVLKFRGAGQGTKALVAEWLAGEMARALGLNVPEIVFVELGAELARTEPDPEIQDLIRASAGLNLALDYLPGALAFDPLAGAPGGDEASAIVWFDALVSNIDRSARNTNLLRWHGRLWLIDHGAALYFHHDWSRQAGRSREGFAPIREHVLLPFADALERLDAPLAAKLTPALIEDLVQALPDTWLGEDAAVQRAAYVAHFRARLEAPRVFVEEAVRARAAHL